MGTSRWWTRIISTPSDSEGADRAQRPAAARNVAEPSTAAPCCWASATSRSDDTTTTAWATGRAASRSAMASSAVTPGGREAHVDRPAGHRGHRGAVAVEHRGDREAGAGPVLLEQGHGAPALPRVEPGPGGAGQVVPVDHQLGAAGPHQVAVGLRRSRPPTRPGSPAVGAGRCGRRCGWPAATSAGAAGSSSAAAAASRARASSDAASAATATASRASLRGASSVGAGGAPSRDEQLGLGLAGGLVGHLQVTAEPAGLGLHVLEPPQELGALGLELGHVGREPRPLRSAVAAWAASSRAAASSCSACRRADSAASASRR